MQDAEELLKYPISDAHCRRCLWDSGKGRLSLRYDAD